MDVLRLVLGLLPASAGKNRLLSATGRAWNIRPTARVGPCLLWRIGRFTVGENAVIEFGNIIRDMRVVAIGDGAEIHRFNQVNGAGKWVHQRDGDLAGSLVLGEQAAIVSRHFLDCSGGISLGRLSVLAGFRSMLLTRGLDVQDLRQQGKPIVVGEHCMIGAAVVIIPGVTIGDRCVVGAGSVVARDLRTPETIYAGNPAVPVRSVEGAPFFVRSEQRMVPKDVMTALKKAGR